MKKIINNKKGFTLIEIVIAVGILAVVITIAARSFTGYMESYRQGRDKANGKIIGEIANVYLKEELLAEAIHTNIGNFPLNKNITINTTNHAHKFLKYAKDNLTDLPEINSNKYSGTGANKKYFYVDINAVHKYVKVYNSNKKIQFYPEFKELP